ncbi:MAG: glycosyltransferase, partial [Deltaproteobacteria bacterium]|nr:glycosyltransferase [Deltaproteobacteria bacterium]
MHPAVSIVIPTYNHAAFLRQALDSVVAQTFTNWEAIVVNNYSEDNTVDVVNSFNDPRVRLVNFRNN